jgi:Tfp pilus assembly protein FimT
MILIGMVIIAVLMALAVPRIRQKLTIPDASHRAPSPGAQER